MTLYLFFALLVLHNPQFEIKFKKSSFPFSLTPLATFAIAILILPTIYFWNIKVLHADLAFQRSLGSSEQGPRYYAEQAYEKNPHQPMYGIQIGKILLAENNKEALETSLTTFMPRVLGNAPRNHDSFVLLGNIYAALENFQYSDQAFLEAITLAPRSPSSLQPWADNLYKQGRVEEAKVVYDHIIRISPKYWQWPRVNLAERPFFEQERYRIFFKENPQFLGILQKLSDIEGTFGNTAQAETYAAALADIRGE
jgi:tetratricopeptide (TPR) repeat protein